MLEIKHLMKKYGKFTAVDDLNLTIPESSIFGFVGPNGAGKTTTMKIMSGLLKATDGSVMIDGVDVTKNPKALKEHIGYMPDFFGVYDDLKVSEYMDFYAGTYYIPYEQREDLINNLLEIVDLSHKKDAYVDGLSRGMKQRLCLARSLIHDPKLLILDEPASGLDPRARVEMKEVLKQLQTMGKTIIISSHILPELAEMCTEVGIIDRGHIVVQGTVQEIMKQMTKVRRIQIRPLENMTALMKLLEEQPLVEDIIEMVYFKEKEGNLEEIFMQVTGGEQK